jgi:hypothetical protein
MAMKIKLVTLFGRSSAMLGKLTKMTRLSTWMSQKYLVQLKKNKKHLPVDHSDFSSRTTSNGSYIELFSAWVAKPCNSCLELI